MPRRDAHLGGRGVPHTSHQSRATSWCSLSHTGWRPSCGEATLALHWWPIGTRCCLLATAVPTTKPFQINNVDYFWSLLPPSTCNLPLCFVTTLFENKYFKGFSSQWNYERVAGEKTCHLVDFPLNMCQVTLRQIARVRYFLLKFT